MNKKNCLICDEEIIYYNESKKMICDYCNKEFYSNTSCKNNHYICDLCHSEDAFKIIKTYLINSDEINPLQMARKLEKHPSVKIHGPEHHFLVPAVLTTSYLNKIGDKDKKQTYLEEIEKRAKNVLGGFCGFYGACGSCVGAGIFISVILNATPLSNEEWSLCNLITSKCLENISKIGGPRCCKRVSNITMETAIDFLEEHLQVNLEKDESFICEFKKYNKECIKNRCKYFRGVI